MATKKNNTRKYAAIALGIVGIAGLSLASAATLNVTENSPLVGVSTGAECDDAVTVSYTTSFDETTGTFAVDSIEVTDVLAACDGKSIEVYVLNNDGDEVGTGSDTISGGGATITPDAAINAASVYQAAVAIS
jgi:hypothetical protein